ncbi:hypothetical protein [Streptomyces adelaidensis]|uniref:hypothetical protein n=1 Tax=Streptomyces adelaidensis TaxID=2796465 RepID=UPI00190815E9|nr:hypothetical protein [Streptomyces adelaidensis]
MICGRCQEAIKKRERYESFVPDSASTAAPTVYYHAWLCPQPPTQTAPISIRR